MTHKPVPWSARGEPPPGAPWDLPLHEAPLAFVDLEMTGLDPSRDRVLEVCVSRVMGAREVRVLTSLVRPDDGRSGNEHVHGIAPEHVADAPTFHELAESVTSLLDGAVLVAHGAAWDVSFLEAELARVGHARTIPHFLDTLVLARRVFGFESHALGALAPALGIEQRRAHRAEDDVRVLRGVFDALIRELRPRSARDLWHVKIGKRHARPELLERLEEARAAGRPLRIRYRPSGKRPVELLLVVTALQTDLDPPKVLGYVLPGRGRRELRADRILSVEAAPQP